MQKMIDIIGNKYKLNEDLRKSFCESLNDEKFKLLVDKLNLKEDILMRYTSRLEESSVEYSNCLNCQNKMDCPNKIKGYALLPRVQSDSLIFNYKACKYEQRDIKNNKYKDNIYIYDMPSNINDASMKNIYIKDKNRLETIKWLTDFINNYENKPKKGLYLHGSFGSGKSYLIAAMFNEMAKKGVRSAIVFWPEYLNELKMSFNSDFKEKNYFKEKFDLIKKIPLLLIDDIGAENVTPWNRDEIFCPLVQYRMDHNLLTFFTSNLDLDALEKHFAFNNFSNEEVKAKRIIERINQLTESINMISKNLRK